VSSKSFECDLCHDVAYVAVLDGREMPMDSPELVAAVFSARPCECLKRKNNARLFGNSNIAVEDQHKGFKDFRLEGAPRCVVNAYNTARDYYERFDEIRHQNENSLVFLGDSGFGKTHLLTAIANNLMAKKLVSVIYFRWEEGMRKLKQAIKESTLDAKIQAMYDVDVLYIDDLFKRKRNTGDVSGFEFQQVLDVVDFRNSNRRPMLVSSELYDWDLAEIDIALWGRIRERSQVLRMGLEDDEKARGIIGNYRMR